MKPYQKTIAKRAKDPLRYAMRDIVYTEFRDCMKHGVIVVSYEEMTNVFINLLAEFMKFQRSKEKKNDMKDKIYAHLRLFSIQIMQLERSANEGNISRDQAVKGFGENIELFTNRIFDDFQSVGKPIKDIFEL